MATRLAEVTLSLDDCEPNALPPVCCKCGQPATCEKEVPFSWYPPWIVVTALIGLLVAVILILVLRKRRTVFMPVCDKHSGVWNWGGAIMGFTFASFLILMFGGLAVLSGQAGAAVAPTLFIALLAYFIVGFFVGAIVQGKAVAPKRIDDYEIRLVNLAPAFVEAVFAQQDADDAAYVAERAKRKPA